ncbi:MAG: alpha/beta hydrolase, partial [Pseudomonadota bacterium]
RQRFDLYLPQASPRGLVVFVHGGYWRRFNRKLWSWVAAGPLRHDWAVAIPGYTLCPDIRISGITRQIAVAIEHLSTEIEGPIRLVGHSAGGHLVTRMLCPNVLAPEVGSRIERTVSISGLHDLSPLLRTTMNETLRLSIDEAREESAATYMPAVKARLTCWVGSDELSEFLRQNTLLRHWRDTGMTVTEIEASGHNHFTVIHPLADPESKLTRELVD